MRIKTKLVLISLFLSITPIGVLLWITRNTGLFHQEDFQSAIVIGIMVSLVSGLAIPLLSCGWLFLNQFQQIRNYCKNIRRGNYGFLELPNEPQRREDENELISIMREMNWMVNQIALRKRQLNQVIEKLRDAQARLQKSERHYRMLVENMGDMVFTLDLNGDFTFISSRSKEVLGYNSEEMVGKNIREFLKIDSIPLFEEKFRRQLQGETLDPYALRFISIEKEEILIEINTSPILDTKGVATGLEGIARDVSERERLQRQLLHAHKMESLGRLAGGIAHDFNNIIQGILGFTEILLMEKQDNDPDYKKLADIKTQALRASRLTKQLLTFSRKDKGRVRPLNLNDEIEKAKEILTNTIPKMIKMEFNLSNDLKTVSADPDQIEQVIMNLAVNARDAMPDGGRLVFKTENIVLDEKRSRDFPGSLPGDYTLLTVSDTGSGMDSETLEHIFEPFYTTKEAGKGTGLGLATVHGIVKEHNGYIYCNSSPGQGTTFKILLPVIEAKTQEVKIQEADEYGMPIKGNGTILLVDDEEAILDLGKGFLEKAGFKVITAKNGEQAVETIRQANTSSIDLVILDLNMPGIGGYKALQRMLEIDPKIKVVISSGYSAQFGEDELKRSGAKGFIAKPYKMEQMLRVVKHLIYGR